MVNDNLQIKDGLVLRTVLISFALFLFIWPVIHANFLFKDDLWRGVANSNLTTWLHDGRFLGLLTMIALGMGHLSDISPIPQILWIPPLAIVLAGTSLRFSLSLFTSVFALSFVAIHPFYLENISFRYEALTMGLASTFALLPFAIPILFPKQSDKPKLLWLYNLLCLIISLNFYQASLNLYGAFTCFFALISLCKSQKIKSIFTDCLIKFSVLVSALIFYLIEMKIAHYLDAGYLNSYGKKHAALTLNPHILLPNFYEYLSLIATGVAQELHGKLLALILLSGLICLFISTYTGLKQFSLKIKSIGLIFSLLLVIGLFVFILGPELFLSWPVYQPRSLIGFGGISATLLCFLCGTTKELPFKSLRYSLCFIAFFSEILLSCSYANAMKAQFEQNDYLASLMVEDTFKLQHSGAKYWATHGVEPIALRAVRTFMAFPVTRKILLSDGLSEKWQEDKENRTWKNIPGKNGIDWDSLSGFYWLRPEFYEQRINSKGGMPKGIYPGWRNSPKDPTQNETVNLLQNGLGNHFKKCQVDQRIEHALYDTYLIGPNLVFDYEKSCSQTKISPQLFRKTGK